MKMSIQYDLSELSQIKAGTLNPADVEDIKQQYYIEVIKSVIDGMFAKFDSTSAFCLSMFYLSDLMDAKTLSSNDEENVNRYIQIKALERGTYNGKNGKS